ncbi:hypothetical protein ACFOTA_15330 [Chitinophaga sp. GCM10012297]|uniref:Outer membrane protein assembly factor BamD n=1 Tax=Chitinophaga chungangae TaxID=2821488 RepID=A0ABS3YFY2_9BACT|nr:hypothetical protein [Chitinophaga chungangae]MBO9153592.1 hypothetical protein [Chitinophaga chungangae]
MKKFLLLVCLGMALSAISFAQLGKMQYEDAEEQFAAGKFKEALSLLDESEKTMGKSNPMIDYLRIMARTELLKKDLKANIGQLETAQNEAKAFLAKYDSDARVEEKYREVYKASKTLAAFPTREKLEKQAAEEKRKKEEEELRKKEEAATNFLPGYRDGMSAEETKKEIAGFQAQQAATTAQLLYFNNYQHVVFISPKTGHSFGYTVSYSFLKSDKECTDAWSTYDEKKKEITRVLGVEPVEEPGQKRAGRNTLSSKWTKGTKTVTLTLVCITIRRSTTATVMLLSDNAQYR